MKFIDEPRTTTIPVPLVLLHALLEASTFIFVLIWGELYYHSIASSRCQSDFDQINVKLERRVPMRDLGHRR